jgi:hypothetical protein
MASAERGDGEGNKDRSTAVEMDDQEYIQKRLQNQIDWYGGKSTWNKRCFICCKICEFVMTASIPFMVGFLNGPFVLRFAIGAFGAAASVIGGIHGLMNYHENWIEYRATSETLKHELYLYQTKSGPYRDKDDPFLVLVERTEGIISHENINWQLLCSEKEKTISSKK